MIIFKKFLTVLLLLLLISNSEIIASEKEENLIETKRSGYWTYYCKNYQEERLCEIIRKINIEGQDETFLITYNISKDINSKIKQNLSIITPGESRINIKKRLKISFDNKTKFTRSFLKCENDSCLVIFKGSKMLNYSFFDFF